MRRFSKSWTIVIVCFGLLGSPCSTSASGDEAVFSFWRNLTRNSQVSSDVEYGQSLAPLSSEMASTCCAISPGQMATLIREGKIVGQGQVESIVAARIPQAGDDRTAFFTVVGIPDSLGESRAPESFPKFLERPYDLFVIGNVQVSEYGPVESPWNENTDLVEVTATALAEQVIDKLWLTDQLGDARSSLESLNPSAVAAVLKAESSFVEYSVVVAGGGLLKVQSLRRTYGPSQHGFVRVLGGNLSNPILIRGTLDFFFTIDGIPHMAMRDSKAGTGMWGYMVYRLEANGVPKLVHTDSSWST